MKVKIFNQGKGWYVSCTNYKDANDKAYMNLHFASSKCAKPSYVDNGRGFSVQDIDIQEAKFTSYKGKVGMTIFKYELLTNVDMLKQDDNSMFGGIRDDLGDNIITDDDFPWELGD